MFTPASAASTGGVGCVGDEEGERPVRLVDERLARDRNRRLVVAERGEEERDSLFGREVEYRPVEFRRTVQRVDGVDLVELVGRLDAGDVLAPEPDALGNVDVDDVARAHVVAGGREAGGDRGAATDAHLQEAGIV